MADKKYYWLKLKKDFFKRHDIQIIESMPNGKDYVLFYLKLLLESVDHEGCLRFSDTIPYNDTMLATITNTNSDTVKSAMKMFIELGMIELLDDQTIYMNEVNKMLGAETAWAEKKRKYRRELGQCPQPVQELSLPSPSDVRQEIEIDKDKEIKKDKKKKPANADFISLFSSYTTNENLIEALSAFVEMRISIKAKPTERAMKMLLNKLDKMTQSDDEKILILENSIMNNWKDIYALKDQQRGNVNAQSFRNDGQGIKKDSMGFEMV